MVLSCPPAQLVEWNQLSAAGLSDVKMNRGRGTPFGACARGIDYWICATRSTSTTTTRTSRLNRHTGCACSLSSSLNSQPETTHTCLDLQFRNLKRIIWIKHHFQTHPKKRKRRWLSNSRQKCCSNHPVQLRNVEKKIEYSALFVERQPFSSGRCAEFE